VTVASEIVAELRARGVRAEPLPHGGIRLVPIRLINPDLFSRIYQHKAELLASLHGRKEAAEIEPLARSYGRTPLPPTSHPAYSILETCQRAGVALRIDPENGDLVVGKAGANVDEPTQPWADLVRKLEAHVEVVATLVEAGWTLRTEFPKEAAGRVTRR
jgi:hypothetical protein